MLRVVTLKENGEFEVLEKAGNGAEMADMSWNNCCSKLPSSSFLSFFLVACSSSLSLYFQILCNECVCFGAGIEGLDL